MEKSAKSYRLINWSPLRHKKNANDKLVLTFWIVILIVGFFLIFILYSLRLYEKSFFLNPVIVIIVLVIISIFIHWLRDNS